MEVGPHGAVLKCGKCQVLCGGWAGSHRLSHQSRLVKFSVMFRLGRWRVKQKLRWTGLVWKTLWQWLRFSRTGVPLQKVQVFFKSHLQENMGPTMPWKRQLVILTAKILEKRASMKSLLTCSDLLELQLIPQGTRYSLRFFVQVPTLVIHGKGDRLIDNSQGRFCNAAIGKCLDRCTILILNEAANSASFDFIYPLRSWHPLTRFS